MSTETLILSGFFILIIILFVVGMFLLPELFGISKKSESIDQESSVENLKNK